MASTKVLSIIPRKIPDSTLAGRKNFFLELFHSMPSSERPSAGILLKLKEAVKQAGIKKDVCIHTFRHTFATHQLEAGQNIVSVKETMGHALLSATMVYLNIARLKANNVSGCLDNLYHSNARQK